VRALVATATSQLGQKIATVEFWAGITSVIIAASMAKRILVVEDDADLRRLYRLTLSLAGYSVDEASDGLEALHLIEQQPPDLVVLDLMLPTVSGYIVQQEIAGRAHTRSMPIVVVTGNDAPAPDVPCVLRKPVVPSRLLEVVELCLSAPSEDSV
jgi:CheY-like chemotaxis protein